METVGAMVVTGSTSWMVQGVRTAFTVSSREVGARKLGAGIGSLSGAFLRSESRITRKADGRCLKVVAQAQSEDSEILGPAGIGAIGGGLVAVPVVAWSLYTLKTTGCGLPPGPGGAIGALEGVSYLAILGVIGWSIYTKVKTGAGLPSGPFGLLGAVEGLSYLTLLAIVVVFGLQALDYGYIPGPVPGEQCFG